MICTLHIFCIHPSHLIISCLSDLKAKPKPKKRTKTTTKKTCIYVFAKGCTLWTLELYKWNEVNRCVATGLNFLIRKMAGFSKPENTIKVEEDGTIVIATNSAFMKNEQRFKLNEEFEEVHNLAKKKFKVSVTGVCLFLCLPPPPPPPPSPTPTDITAVIKHQVTDSSPHPPQSP